jgi:hypothetical protein
MSQQEWIRHFRPLTEEQIQTFANDGVLVVENVLTSEELESSRNGLHQTLAQLSVDTDDLIGTGHALRYLSSTNGSGGVLDIFYDEWKMRIASNPTLFSMTCQLWDTAYCHSGETAESLDKTQRFKWHPYGEFDCNKGYMFIDRIGYRLPTALAEQLGTQLETHSGLKRNSSLQRSLTPHLDCCPDNLFTDKSKWRPIQCFVSLTDTVEPNAGGFEVATGFHHDFADWAKRRPPTVVTRKQKDGTSVSECFPAPCIGEYTHIRPREDRNVMDRVQHVPVPAGSAVFWDNRLPHANAYRHDGNVPRSVVYCSFLPDVPINRLYAEKQLQKWKEGRNPNEQWIKTRENSVESSATIQKQLNDLSPLARTLLLIDKW